METRQGLSVCDILMHYQHALARAVRGLQNELSPYLPAVRRLHTRMLLALQDYTAGGRQGCNAAPHASRERTPAAATALRAPGRACKGVQNRT